MERRAGPGDRRGTIRFEIVGRLWGTFEALETLALRNIGPGGALVESGLPLDARVTHRVRLSFHEEAVDFAARVRHSMPVPGPTGSVLYLIGLEFVGLDARASAQIDRLMALSGTSPGPAGS